VTGQSIAGFRTGRTGENIGKNKALVGKGAQEKGTDNKASDFLPPFGYDTQKRRGVAKKEEGKEKSC